VILASPLSRAVDTADLVLPPSATKKCARRIIREEWREISGWLINAQRMSQSSLQAKYAAWDVSTLPTEEDSLWTNELESEEACAERGYQGLCYIWDAIEEEEVAVAAHGGIFSFLMGLHPCVEADETMKERFSNCQLKSCEMTLLEGGGSPTDTRRRFKLRAVAAPAAAS